MWIRGRQVGGKTFCWARVSYRYSDFEFQAAARDGYGENWPITYKDLEPYYDKVERYIGVSGSAEGLPQFPDGSFLPPMRLSCGEIHAGKIVEKPLRLADYSGPHREFDGAAQWPARLPLLRPMPARLLHGLVLQQSLRPLFLTQPVPAGSLW